MADTDDPLADLSDEEIRILPPDYSLKKLVGNDVNLREIFNGEAIGKVQEAIDKHKGSFLEWVKKDLQTLEQHYDQASTHFPACEEDVKKLSKAAFVIKSQAGTFGFILATRVAKSLDDFCTRHFRPATAHMTVIRKHVDALTAIFHKNITGDGARLGNELLGSLAQLVEKYK